MNNKWLKIFFAIIVCELAGGIGSIFTMPSITGLYAGLVKAPLNPPNWLFGPVWTILFALMGIAAYLVWEKRKDKAAVFSLRVFVLQLALNVFWSIIFFTVHNPLLALFDIIILWLAIVWTMVRFWKISRPAGALLLPYLLWVSFATYLNYYITIAN